MTTENAAGCNSSGHDELASTDPIWVATGAHTSKKHFHTDPDCPRLARAANVRETIYRNRPLRSQECADCQTRHEVSE